MLAYGSILVLSLALSSSGEVCDDPKAAFVSAARAYADQQGVILPQSVQDEIAAKFVGILGESRLKHSCARLEKWASERVKEWDDDHENKGLNLDRGNALVVPTIKVWGAVQVKIDSWKLPVVIRYNNVDYQLNRRDSRVWVTPGKVQLQILVEGRPVCAYEGEIEQGATAVFECPQKVGAKDHGV